MRPYLAQIKSNLRLVGRDRTVLFFNLFFPLILFIVFGNVFGGARNPTATAQTLSIVLIIGILSSGFFGAGVRAVQERESNVLRRFKVTPSNAAPIIVASMVTGLVSFLPTVLFFLLLGRVMYHMPLPPNVLSLLVFVSIGSLTFRAVGMIIAAVVNSPQESQIITQFLYLPMLFLSGATFPVSIMPSWVQVAAQFLPATYLFQGMQSILINGGSILSNLLPVIALIVTMLLAVFIGTKLFRWEKEERIARSAKLWVLAVLAPFFLLGFYQAKTLQNVQQSKITAHLMRRGASLLYTNARVFVGDGKVIPNGAVLVRNGKIAQVFLASPASTKNLSADVIDISGKTIVPGLIDTNVRLELPGGIYENPRDYQNPDAAKRALSAYLYSGVTAVRSAGDSVGPMLALRARINSAELLGAQPFVFGPLFTAKGGFGAAELSYMPQSMRSAVEQQLLRMPASAEEARGQVAELAEKHVDGIRAVLDSGSGKKALNRLATPIYRALVEEAKRRQLPVATRTASVEDIQIAIDAGTEYIEHGSGNDPIPIEIFVKMKEKAIAFDPVLSALEADRDLSQGRLSLLDRSLVQQVGPHALLQSTRKLLQDKRASTSIAPDLDAAKANLMAAYRAGVQLVTGSDAGHLLVVHGPTVQHELQLWSQAGIPPSIGLQSATSRAAQILGAETRLGRIQEGKDATFVIIDGDPTRNIDDLERVTQVIFHGERVDRSNLLNSDKN